LSESINLVEEDGIVDVVVTVVVLAGVGGDVAVVVYSAKR